MQTESRLVDVATGEERAGQTERVHWHIHTTACKRDAQRRRIRLPLQADARIMGLIPGWGRSPGEGNGNPLQYSCLEIPWTEEPSGLQSTGSQRVRHDWAAEHTRDVNWNSEWDPTVQRRDFSSVLCDDPKEWDTQLGGREAQEQRIYVRT